MVRFAANISTMYGEFEFLDRYAAAAADGFAAVECQFPYEFTASDVRERLTASGLQHVLLNAPPGNWAAGDRGLASLPERVAEFRAEFAQAHEYAKALDCPRIHVMAGITPPHGSRDEAAGVYVENLAWACAQTDRLVLIEPINARDMPGYFLSRLDDAYAIVAQVGAPNLAVQLDLYHCQITEGDLTQRLRSDIPGGSVGHIQIASVPDRAEPDSGEVDYGWVLGVLDEIGYDGWVGLEYSPRAGTRDGLGWLRVLSSGPKWT